MSEIAQYLGTGKRKTSVARVILRPKSGGDAVTIKYLDGRELGRGLVAYAKPDAERLIGRKSAEIESILGYPGRSEMIHRDDMVLNRS